MSSSESELSFDASCLLIRQQIFRRLASEDTDLAALSATHVLPMTIRVPDIEHEVKALFCEADFLEVSASSVQQRMSF